MSSRNRPKSVPRHSPMVTRSNRIEATTVTVTQGHGSGKNMEIRFFDQKIIGNGSFGTVYMAILYDTRETVAIKKVKQEKRYKNRELMIMKKLEHPNIVRLMYYFKKTEGDEEYLHLILEFMPKTLSQLYKTGAPVPEFNIKLYMFQLLRGLAFMHSFSICHRDIKPQNLLVDPDYGVLKICDFGSAKALNDHEINVSYICSRYYRAPELAYGAVRYTTAVDMWAMATVLLELYLMQPAFHGETASDQISVIMKVLGTPSKEELISMNPDFKDKEYVVRKSGTGIHRMFTTEPAPKGAVDLVKRILKYTPSQRIVAKEAMADPYFAVLKKPNLTNLPNGKLMPRIFDWYEKEYSVRPELNSLIFPDLVNAGDSNSHTNGHRGSRGSRESTLSPEPHL